MLVGLLAADGELAWASVAESSRSRIVPWRPILRVPRFGPGLSPALRDVAIDALIQFAGRHRALRVHVATFEPEDETRGALRQALAQRGFVVAEHAFSYQNTVLIDLRRSEETVFATFHAKTRRDVRALGKAGLLCAEIMDATLSARMNELLGISMGRTGGRFVPTRWADVIEFIAREPTRAALIGVFRPDREGPDSLVGYVLGYRHGNMVQYGIAACARLTDVRAPLLYAPTWELMRWGQRNGAEWFDFGGVTSGTLAKGDRAGGISEFKRYFRSEITPVSMEMIFTPSPLLSQMARSLSAVGTALAARLG